MIEHSSLTPKQKRIVYRANHRGTKEMDWLLGKFIEGNVANMDDAALDHIDELMKLAEPVIEGWLMGKSDDYPDEFAELIKEIQTYHEL